MIARPETSRRGVALLIVLATLVLAVSASVSVAEVAATSRARRLVTARAAVADELLRSAEAPIEAWLRTVSAEIVLPPESTAPSVAVLDDRWVAGGLEHALRIIAWDQCGMVPIEAAGTASPLRLALPDPLRRALDGAGVPRDGAPGLDLFVGGAGGPRVYPPAGGEPAAAPALGAVIGTHGRGRINVCTAPVPLLERAMRLAGRGGGIAAVLEARAAGEPPAAPGDGSSGDGARDEAGEGLVPVIATASNAWAFRIDIEIGAPNGAAVRRAWWVVYRNEGSGWECVQRLAITE